MLSLPNPTGHFGVGTTTYYRVDKSRKEKLAKNSSTLRELVFQLWYPTDQQEKHAHYPYMPQVLPFVKKALSHASNVPLEKLQYIDQLKTYAAPEAAISLKEQRYPVIIFSPGMGENRGLYTSSLEELASQGYIVVALDHTYSCRAVVFPEERIICNTDSAEAELPENFSEKSEHERFEFMLTLVEHEMPTWVADVQFVLDELERINTHDPKNLLTNKLDLEHIGVFGHSFGGAAAIQAARIDPRCKAIVNMDGSLFGENKEQGFHTPLMFLASKLLAENYTPTDQELVHMQMSRKLYNTMLVVWKKEIETLFNTMSNDTYLVILNNFDHMSFSDWNFLYPMQKPNVIEPVRGIAITRLLLVSFFDQYLKDSSSMLWQHYIKRFPEITLAKHKSTPN